MKTMRSIWGLARVLFVIGAVLSTATKNFGQTSSASNSVIPVVTIQATYPLASWSGDTGVFTVFRAGNPTNALNVFYEISGTASNGVDYQTIGNYVQLASGVMSNTIVIQPINRGQTNTGTVTLQLAQPPVLTPQTPGSDIPVNYTIGYPSNATVYILPVGATNIPPFVSITSPTNGSEFPALTNIELIAEAGDVDGFVTSVQFFAGTNSLGVVTNWVVVDPPVPPGSFIPGTRAFFLNWTNVPAGSYALTALATDNGGATTVSAPVSITVGPVSHLPPKVSIVAPTNGAAFPALTNIQITADTEQVFGTVTRVEFFAGTNSLGVVTNWTPPPVASPMFSIMQVFSLIWSNAPPGDYALTALATDNEGESTVSAPVNITVGPVSNLPPVVRITSPPNNAVFRAPVTIPIFAYAHDPDGSVSSVEFFDGTNSLGFGRSIGPVPVTPLVYSTPVSPGPGPVPPGPIIIPSNIFVFVWSNAPVGVHVLTAVATDNDGASTTSDPVNITILPGLPPPTNCPPIVSIVATAPVAIEGTNCWPWVGLGGGPLTWSNWTSASAVRSVFTNRGPKDAVFTVRRWGETTNDLTVTYGIGGTASNGMNYETLPGVVTIPAGECSTRITVVPLDGAPTASVVSTVILTLTPSTNTPPDYVVGVPDKAAAIILDGVPPWPPVAVLADGCFHLNQTGPDGAWFHIEYSTDTVHWTPICTNQVVGGAIDFVDPDAPGSNARYYRAVPELSPPIE
jgi:hypothetical protein